MKKFIAIVIATIMATCMGVVIPGTSAEISPFAIEASAMTQREAIVQTALAEVGTVEGPGYNDVKYNTAYYGHTINSGGYAWCNAFVWWCAKSSGISEDIVPKSAYVPTTRDWYINKGLFHRNDGSYEYEPQPGDLIFYGSSGGSHIGIVVDYCDGDYIQSVEGNVYVDGKWQVYHFTHNYKRRLSNLSYVYGFASPDYSNSGGSTPSATYTGGTGTISASWSNPIYLYCDGYIPVASDSSLSDEGSYGYIYPEDDVEIYSIGDNSSYVSYPTSYGRKYGYVDNDYLFWNKSGRKVRCTSDVPTYIYSDFDGRAGSIDAGDDCIVLGSDSDCVLIYYPVNSGHKIAYIPSWYLNNYFA